ncbi:MAG: beta-N-acetylhexosaminidase [Bacteroidetes bacterium]|nr:beta-N-acetylhexosaminidase [Bacteroidota bacterium]
MKYHILSLLTFLFMISASAQTNEIPIVPSPQVIKLGKGNFTLNKNINISITGSKAYLKFSAEQIKETLKNYLNISAKIIANDSAASGIVFSLNDFKSEENIPVEVKDQSYNLTVNKDGIKITSTSARGIFYGTMSLIQLLEKANSKEIPFLNITDWPDIKLRGISDDISRGQVSTLDNFKKIIRNIARYKMNVYMPYLEDMIQFPQYPDIGKNRGALSEKEITELVNYAKQYYVDIIPIFQTLGHYENILSQEKYLKYAEFPGAASLNVSNDSTYIFLESMMKEVFKLFPSEYYHMGADESFDVGLGASKFLVDKYGIAKVHADHYKKIYDICKKYGKKVMMYGDIILRHPEILSMIPKDITIVDWHYVPTVDYPSTKIFKDAGFKYIVSPSVSNYSSPFPVNVNALPNIQYFIKAGIENGSEGMINSNWGDFGAETFKELIYFGYAWSAQCSWNYNGSDLSTFSKNYFYDFFGLNDERIPKIYETLSNPLNQMTWSELWRHPLLVEREHMQRGPNLMPASKVEWMNWTLPQTLKDIDNLEPKVQKHKDQFDILRFIVKLDEWYKSKIETQYLLHDKSYLQANENDKHLVKLIDKDVSSLNELHKEYDNLWLKYYVEANLNLIDDKFQRLKEYFEEIKDSLNSGDKNLYSPLIKSKWIYVKVNEDSLASKAEFQKTLKLKEIPKEAFLQLMGDTYARLYIDDKFVDEVYARRTLSLTVEHKRIKFLDVKKYLRKGENTFLVKVVNYNPNGAAGFNIASNFIVGKGTLNIDTNDDNTQSSWKGKTEGGEWKNVVSKKYPNQIIAPDFHTKRPSWIER